MSWGTTGINLRGPNGNPWPAPQVLVDGATVSPALTGSPTLRLSTGRAAVTINVPSGGTDGWRYLFVVTCSAACTLTFASGYELGGVVTSRTVAVAAGKTAYIGTDNRSGTYRLLAVDPGS